MRVRRRPIFLLSMECVLIISVLAMCFASLTVTDYVHVWFSNCRFLSYTKSGELAIFDFADITSHYSDNVEWSSNGIENDVYVGNVTIVSLSEGIVMWANDSLNAYEFPTVLNDDDIYYDKLHCKVLNVEITASKNGMKSISVPFYGTVAVGPQGASLLDDPRWPSYAYVDLDEIDALLEIHGEESYTLSVSMDLSYRVSFPALPLPASNPSPITGQERLDFGHINVSCVEGKHTHAHISFPYREFSYTIAVPYVKTILRL